MQVLLLPTTLIIICIVPPVGKIFYRENGRREISASRSLQSRNMGKQQTKGRRVESEKMEFGSVAQSSQFQCAKGLAENADVETGFEGRQIIGIAYVFREAITDVLVSILQKEEVKLRG